MGEGIPGAVLNWFDEGWRGYLSMDILKEMVLWQKPILLPKVYILYIKNFSFLTKPLPPECMSGGQQNLTWLIGNTRINKIGWRGRTTGWDYLGLWSNKVSSEDAIWVWEQRCREICLKLPHFQISRSIIKSYAKEKDKDKEEGKH